MHTELKKENLQDDIIKGKKLLEDFTEELSIQKK